jgi:Holliday junction resolvasome RuvABC endonuclease subunit
LRILGIDPSLSATGLAIIETRDGNQSCDVLHVRTIKTTPREVLGDRLGKIVAELTSVMSEYKPDAVAMEGYSMGSTFNREAMGEVGGVIKLALWGFGVDPKIWPVQSWRKAVFAEKLVKDEVRLKTFQRYGVDLKDMNQLEAFCVAVAEFLAAHGGHRPRPKKSRKASPATCGSCGSAGLCDCTVSPT